MKANPSVGQIVYALNLRSVSRNMEQKLTPMIVTRVGYKFFHCVERDNQKGKHIPFCIENWKQVTDYTETYRLYETEQEWFDNCEVAKLCNFIRQSFEYGGNTKKLPIESLRAIRDIIEGNEIWQPPTGDPVE